ncbi:MAG TPA: hypothetical protein VK425_02295 [Acidimicrobiales bacterium]|nr:hypothetical protein [Acidimicrobiales bacterium]
MHAQFSAVGAGHGSDLPALFQWDDFTGEPPRFAAEQHVYAVQLARYLGPVRRHRGPSGPDLPG